MDFNQVNLEAKQKAMAEAVMVKNTSEGVTDELEITPNHTNKVKQETQEASSLGEKAAIVDINSQLGRATAEYVRKYQVKFLSKRHNTGVAEPGFEAATTF